MRDHWKLWIEVGKAIAADPKVQALCPVCAAATLDVWDTPWEKEPERWERHMRCPACSAYNSLRMEAPAPATPSTQRPESSLKRH